MCVSECVCVCVCLWFSGERHTFGFFAAVAPFAFADDVDAVLLRGAAWKEENSGCAS